MGRSYQPYDQKGAPTGAMQNVNWTNVRRFSPNPTVSDFEEKQCVSGGAWVVRDSSFFVSRMWLDHNKTLDSSITRTWQECAKSCEAWTVRDNQPLFPCAMWSWVENSSVVDGLAPHTCLLAQGGGPITTKIPGFFSGCQFGTVCNETLPNHGNSSMPITGTPSPALLKECDKVHQAANSFAANYTSFLVSLHNLFNGQPDSLGDTIGQMYTLKGLAIDLMNTPDPRIQTAPMGVGPPWEYVPSASQFDARGGKARPLSSPGE